MSKMKSIDFLWYSYFNCEIDDLSDEWMVQIAINKAYTDATNQGALNTLV